MTMTIAERIVNRRCEELPPTLNGPELDAALSGQLHVEVTALLRQKSKNMPPPLPHARLWCTRLAPAILECMEGKRPPTQLRRYLDDDPMGRLSRRFRTAQRRGFYPQPGHVIRVHVSQPNEHVIESVIVAQFQGRPTAMAMRLEARHDRWVVTVLQVL